MRAPIKNLIQFFWLLNYSQYVKAKMVPMYKTSVQQHCLYYIVLRIHPILSLNMIFTTHVMEKWCRLYQCCRQNTFNWYYENSSFWGTGIKQHNWRLFFGVICFYKYALQTNYIDFWLIFITNLVCYINVKLQRNIGAVSEIKRITQFKRKSIFITNMWKQRVVLIFSRN